MVKHNEVITPTFFLCVKEFFIFHYELQSSLYFGCARSLRCILETALEACDFQSQKHRPLLDDLFAQYLEVSKTTSVSDKEKLLNKLLFKNNGWVAFKESYKIREEAKRIAPSFKEMVNRLKSRNFFSEAPMISDELKEIYEKLSDFVHPSSERIEKQMEKRPEQIPRYNNEDFMTMYNMSLKVLDITQFIYIEAMSRFLGYKKANDFLRELSVAVTLTKKEESSFLKLPHVSKLARRIRWKTETKKKTK